MDTDELFQNLQAAITATPPACLGDARFIDDNTGNDDALRTICTGCPINAACYAYAAAEHPKGGFWAGRRRFPQPESRTA